MMAACCSDLRPCRPHSPQDRIYIVTFSIDGLTGVPLKDILEGTPIDQPSDDVSVEFQGDCIALSLQWPGYESNLLQKFRHNFVERVVDGIPTTRQELAIQICLLFFTFHKMASKLRISNSQGKFGPGEDDIRVTDVVLYSVHYCNYTNTWMPIFGVVDRAGLERHNRFTTSEQQLHCLHCNVQ
ncbi:hypothetical protein EDD17DRAFT_1146593 [Pisolithus thermaeus]|nr:hypothetical protein EV401DRAFT_837946 [Pisolithus croceorrhizus]KAI6151299.1 hypothetical protein EDD17DRAFT_1146593 [Pisolithus thermaeus]